MARGHDANGDFFTFMILEPDWLFQQAESFITIDLNKARATLHAQSLPPALLVLPHVEDVLIILAAADDGQERQNKSLIV